MTAPIFTITTLLKSVTTGLTDDDRAPISGDAVIDWLDYQDMEMDPQAFAKSIPEYMAKGAPILFEHYRDIILGKATDISFAPSKNNPKKAAMKVKGFLFAPNELPDMDVTTVDEVSGRTVTLNPRKVAKGLRQYHELGVNKGLSIGGKAKKRGIVPKFVKSIGKYVPRVVEALLYSISVTSLQVVPGAQYEIAFSKALELEGLRVLKAAEKKRRITLDREPSRYKIDLKSGFHRW